MEFKTTLNSLMEQRGHSLGSLAKGTGISKSSLHGYLQGAEPSLTNMMKLARFYGVSLDYLATGSMPDPIEQMLKVQVHSGLYEVNIKKVIKPGDE